MLETEFDITPGLHRARLRYPDIDLERCRLIGWGAGGVFARIYPRLGIKLDYTVCIWNANIGKTVCGVEVHAADRLRDEDPAEVLVVVFSTVWYDCMRQLGAYGRFRVVRAHDEHPPGHDTQGLLRAFFNAPPVRAPRHMEVASIGILVQGPVLPHITARVLADSHRRFPFARRVLSTWEGTPPELIAECEPYVDEVVQSPVPACAGAFNTVVQRDSTLAGLAALADQGVRYAFKTRTDQSILGAGNLDRLLTLLRLPVGGEDRGRRERIAFCGLASFRFIPFHLTDQLQFGRVDDLLEFWDARDDSLLGSVVSELSQPANSLAMYAPEPKIVRCYLRRIGVPHDVSVESYWQVVADRFMFMPERDFHVLNWKAVPLFDIAVERGPGAAEQEEQANLMTTWFCADLTQLIADRASAGRVARAVDRLGLTVHDYYHCRPFALPRADRPAAEGG